MGYVVTLRRNADGLVRSYDMGLDWTDDLDYLWEEGNCGCDCNRAIFFDRAANPDGPSADHPCGNTAFTVTAITLPDGTVVYEED